MSTNQCRLVLVYPASGGPVEAVQGAGFAQRVAPACYPCPGPTGQSLNSVSFLEIINAVRMPFKETEHQWQMISVSG